VKLVQNRFTELSQEPNVSFYGNVEVGRDISVADLKRHFQVIILAYGCSQPKGLNVVGEAARGVYHATDFTNWYNGAPFHFHRHDVNLTGNTAVIVGTFVVLISLFV
jgi:NADPH-dependent glutamate synthase beta subunit-like oxidoreductase